VVYKGWKRDSLLVMKLMYCVSTCNLFVLIVCSKHELRQLMEIAYLHSTYSMTVLNMDSKPDSRKVIN